MYVFCRDELGRHRHVVIAASSAFKETSVPSLLCRVPVPSMTVDGLHELSNGDTCASDRRGHRGIRISLSAINHKTPQFRQALPSGIRV